MMMMTKDGFSESTDAVVTKKSLIEEVHAGREISEMYLKHPANESSSDDEGSEASAGEIGKNNKLGNSFKLLLYFYTGRFHFF
jgi:hypothetical protein